MAYADYTFYTETYKGNAILKTDFDRLALRASGYIDHITGGRAKTYITDDAVNMVACAVAEAWQINEQGGELSSQSVGSWSRSYNTTAKSTDARLYDAASMRLLNKSN